MILCSCMTTSHKEIDRLIESGITDYKEIIKLTRSGRICGGCVKNIKDYVKRYHERS
jgi:bacterioferritin-associated ferredoxin